MTKKKIPKYFLKALRKRTSLAQEMSVQNDVIDCWLEKEGLFYENCIDEFVCTGIMIYTEPFAAEQSLLDYLKEKGYE